MAVVTRGDFEYCNRLVGSTLILWLAGGSNARGNNGTTGNPATAGFTKPGNVTLYEDGVLQASYPTDHHGPEVGMIDELVTVHGYTDPIVIYKLGVPGTNLPNWKSTYCAQMIGYWALAGKPLHGLFINGANDSTQQAQADAYGTNLNDFCGQMRRDIGGGMGIGAVQLYTVDQEDFPYTDTVKTAQSLFETQGQGYKLIDPLDLVADHLSSDSHWDGFAVREFGRRYIQDLIADGVIP